MNISSLFNYYNTRAFYMFTLRSNCPGLIYLIIRDCDNVLETFFQERIYIPGLASDMAEVILGIKLIETIVLPE